MEAGCFQVVEALGSVFGRKLIAALQLHNESSVHNDVRRVLTNRDAFVENVQALLCLSGYPTRTQLAKQRPLIHLLQEPASKFITNLKSRPDHHARKVVQSVSIRCRHLRQPAFIRGSKAVRFSTMHTALAASRFAAKGGTFR